MVRIRDLHDDTAERVPKVATGADQRALGVQVDMEGYWKGATKKASAEVDAIYKVDAISQIVGGEMWEDCGVAEIAVQTEAA